MKERIAIIAEGNSIIGGGHIYRCISIAEKLVQMDLVVTFYSSSINFKQLIEDSKCDFVRIKELEKFDDSDWKKLADRIACDNNSFVLIDSYKVEHNGLSQLKKKVLIGSFGNYNPLSFSYDMLINYSVTYDNAIKENYKKYGTRLLLGSKYLPLRKEFESIPPKKISNIVKNIFISIGLSDKYDIIPKILQGIIKDELYEQYHFVLVLGSNQKKENIQKIAENIENISVLFNVKNIEKYMQQSDLAISSLSTTLYELAVCGVPTVAFAHADDQVKSGEIFKDKFLVEYVGNIRYETDIVNKILLGVNALAEDYKHRRNSSERMQQEFDGKGAERIARKILEIIKEKKSFIK